MKKIKLSYFKFSISRLLVLVFVLAITLHFWPAPTQPRKAGDHRYTIDDEEMICHYFWCDSACGKIWQLYGGGWQPCRIEQSTGNCISIYHQIYEIGTFNSCSCNTIMIQLPSSVSVGEEFKISTAASNRPSEQNDRGDPISSLNELEACVWRYDDPNTYFLANEKDSSLGSIKILSMNPKFVRVELNFINEVMMKNKKNGISKVIELERHKTTSKSFIP